VLKLVWQFVDRRADELLEFPIARVPLVADLRLPLERPSSELAVPGASSSTA